MTKALLQFKSKNMSKMYFFKFRKSYRKLVTINLPQNLTSKSKCTIPLNIKLKLSMATLENKEAVQIHSIIVKCVNLTSKLMSTSSITCHSLKPILLFCRKPVVYGQVLPHLTK